MRGPGERNWERGPRFELFFDREKIGESLAGMLSRALHADGGHGGVLLESAHHRVVMIGVVICSVSERAHRQRVNVTAQNRHSFFQVLGTVAIHDRTRTVFELPRSTASLDHDRASAASRHDRFE